MLRTSKEQIVPVRIHQTGTHIVVVAPMPGLAPTDISVRVRGNTVVIRGEYRGPGQEARDLLLVEWTIGRYLRKLVLPEPVNGALTNATYGNGILVLSMPKLALKQEPDDAEFRLETRDTARGQRVGNGNPP
jgi:HSP20 family protein